MKILLDHQQQRLKRDRYHVCAAAVDLDKATVSNCWIDPVNGFVTLKPYRLDDDWFTSNSGSYAKTPLSSFTVYSGAFETLEIPSAGAGPWISLTPASSGGGGLRTTSALAANRGFSLSVFNYGGDKVQKYQPVCSFGWGNNASSADIAFDLYADGTLDYYTVGASGLTLTESNSISSVGSDQNAKNPGTFFDIMVMPYNGTDILVWSANGGSFVITTPSTAITPNSSFYIEVTGQQAMLFQFAPLSFHSAGTIESNRLNFIEPPASGSSLQPWSNDSWIGVENYRVYGSPGGGSTQDCVISLRNWDGGAFSANGSNTETKLRFSLSTSSDSFTPTINGGQMAYDGEYALTDDAEFDLTPYVHSASLSIPEDPRSVSFNCTLSEAASAALSVPSLYTQQFRPISVLDDDDVVIFDGIITNLNVNRQRLITYLEIQAGDGIRVLENYTFRERVPLAKELFTDCIEFLAGKFNSQTPFDISTSTFYMPYVATPDMDDWGKVIDVGDQASEALEDIMSTYAGTWYWGYRPTASGMGFYAWDPVDMPVSGVVLYESRAAALSVGGTGAVDDVWYQLQSETLPAEANVVFVTGYNPVKKTLFQYKKADYSAQDPTVAVESRPSNWSGLQLPYGLIDPQITSEEAAEFACETLFTRLTVPRELVQWQSKYLKSDGLPLWRGDVVTFYGIDGSESSESYRITSLSFDWDKNTTRTVSYTGEKI